MQAFGVVQPTVTVRRLQPTALSDFQNRGSSAVAVLFTPTIASTYSINDNMMVDPFEAFGRSLATNEVRIRHVPYIPTQGLTSFHVAFIERSSSILLVISDATPGNPQLGFAASVRAMAGARPIILISVSNPPVEVDAATFPNLISVPSYQQSALDAVGALILSTQGPSAT